MTHPQARSKPRPRGSRSKSLRYRLTDNGRALLELHEQLARAAVMRGALHRAGITTEARAAPCAPNRAARVAPAPEPNPRGHAACAPAHPAGKSGAALAPPKETRR